MNLYQISTELSAKMTALGELLLAGKEPSEAETEVLIALDGDLDKKLVDYGYVIKDIEAQAEVLDAEIKRLTAKKKAKERHVELLKERMQTAMIEHDKDKIDDPIMPIRLQNSAPSVRIDVDVASLPQEYQKITITANRTLLGKAIKDGAMIDGVVLEQKQHIRIG